MKKVDKEEVLRDYELRLIGAMKLINYGFPEPGTKNTKSGDWDEINRLKSQAWSNLYDAWYLTMGLNEEDHYDLYCQAWGRVEALSLNLKGEVYATATDR